jgi:hypothetical protein
MRAALRHSGAAGVVPMTESGARRVLRWAVLGLGLMLVALPSKYGVRAEVLELQPDEVLLTAQAAYASGNHAVANRLARALLLVDPNDAYALLIIAATEPKLGNPVEGMQAGQAAWRAARTAGQPEGLRYEIARNTALAAYAAGRPGMAQFWLRRSLDVAPDETAFRKSGEDLGYVRNQNPWRWQMDFEAGPSDNLNGGAADPIFRIDGHVIGELANGSEALSGARASLRFSAFRALPRQGKTQTVLGFSFQSTVNQIDKASQVKAGTLTSDDLNSTKLAGSAQFNMMLGASDVPLSLSVEAGQTWVGGEVYGPHLRFSAQTAVWRGDAGRSVWLAGEVERQWQDGGDTADNLALTLIGERAIRGGAGQMSLGLTAEVQEAGSPNATYRAATLVMGVDPGWTLGPAAVSFSANAGWRHYDTFSLGFAYVTNGRTDESVGLAVDLTLEDWSVMGFAPVVTLSHGRTQSNVSRYETETTAISLGISSVF